MKELKPLKIEELTLEQKIALTICATPIIGEMQAHIRIQNSHERNGRKIVTFGNHLRTHEYIRFLLGKCFQNFVMPLFTARGIVIHSQYLRVGVKLL